MWKNRKFKGRKYQGMYQNNLGKREFVLYCHGKNPARLYIQHFKSPQDAVKQGWKKCKKK